MQIAQIESTEMQLGHAMAAEDVMSTIQRPHTNSLQASSQNEHMPSNFENKENCEWSLISCGRLVL